MKYNNPENTSLSTGRFNGNTAEIDWRTSTVANDNKRRYSFTNDKLNRLQQGIYSEPGSSVVNNNNYNEQLTYDLNGNILTLKRFSKPYSGTTPELIDDLVYNYTGNRLDKITLPSGTVNNASGYNALQNAITYNANGSMVNQLDKNIASIDYNHLNLPRLFTTGSGKFKQTIAYTYRADGVKVGKNVGGRLFFSTTTDYLDGFQYQVSLVGDGQDSSNFLQFFPTSEGYFDFQQNKYIYNYTDHLGNVRLSYFNNGSGTEVLEENNYYPFGLKHGGYNELAGNPAYQYKYNGKELQTETGMYDYGARFYMPDIGRWGVVDPLAEKYQELSPYRYSFNNPVNFVDPVGLTEEDPPNKKGIRETAIEEVVITVKRTNNWLQRNIIDPIAGFIRNDEHKRQPQVLPSINTFWSRFYQREWSDPNSGLTYIVTRDGKISHVKSIGGAGPLEYISGAGELKYLLASKEALETFKSTEIAAQSTEKVQKLAKLMKEGDISIYGEKIVVYLKDGERYILDGHHRIQAAIQENKTLEVIEVTGQKAMQMFKDKVKQIDSGLFK